MSSTRKIKRKSPKELLDAVQERLDATPERIASMRWVSTFGGRRRIGGKAAMDLALSVLLCYVLALFSIR